MKLDKTTRSSAAAYILGLSPMTKVVGTKDEIDAFTEALVSSRALYTALNESRCVDTISRALADKSKKAHEFARVCGHNWPF